MIAVLVALALLIPLALATLLFLVPWAIARRLTRVLPRTYWDTYTYTPWEMGIEFQEVCFPSGDGLSLSGWLLPRPETDRVIILASGYRGRKPELLGACGYLWRQGFGVFALDLRGQGESQQERYLTMGYREVQDVLAAVDYVCFRIPGARVGVLGYSMGAAVAVMAAARDPRIRVVVADSGFAFQKDIVAHNFTRVTHLPAWPFVDLAEWWVERRAGFRPSWVCPADEIGKIAPRPVLIIHGVEDDLVPVEQARTLYRRAGDPKELWLLEGAKHAGAYFVDRKAYCQRIAGFFERWLA